jgi:cytochrome d ubiquinol oxidase subunit I
MELVHQTSSDVPEYLLGRLQEDGSVHGGLAIPGLASWLADHRTGRATVIQGLADFPADAQPTTLEVNVVHWAWDVMVGLGALLFGLSLWFGASWLRRRDLPRSAWFLRAAAAAGVAAVIAMEAGWVVTEVGRQPWILFGHMKVAQAATGDEKVQLTFWVVVGLYLAIACTLVWILRVMARRFRAGDERVEDAPYGPQVPHASIRRPVERRP